MKYAVDLCCGKGGGTQAFRGKDDWIVVGVDVDKRFYQYWQGKNVSFVLADVTAVDWQSFLEDVGIPRVDFLWASPPCERFSIACRTWPKMGIKKAMELVGACFEAVSILKPKAWIIENPMGRLRWFLGKPPMTLRLCDYGAPYEKKTDLWANINLPMIKAQKQAKFWVLREGTMHPNQVPKPVANFFIHGTSGSGNGKANRAMMPYGLSEAVYTSVQSRLLSAGSSTEESAATVRGNTK